MNGKQQAVNDPYAFIIYTKILFVGTQSGLQCFNGFAYGVSVISPTHRLARAASANHSGGHIAGNEAAGADDGVLANLYTRQHKRSRTDKGVCANADFFGSQIHRRSVKGMSAGAEVNFLGDRSVFVNFNGAERIRIRPVAQSRAVVQY